MDKFYCYTTALCPQCKEKVNTKIIERDAKIYMEKLCPDHGISYSMICSDPLWYRDSMNYIKPSQKPIDISVHTFTGCPDSCGLCPEHQQHTCLPVIEITNSCDLGCPICLKNLDKPFEMTINEFENILNTLLRCEGKVPVINLSGGEPTLHPHFEEFLKLAVSKDITQTTVSTNGLKLLEDKKLRDIFKETDSIVALQFDGFSSETYNYLRGKDISKDKLDLINILENEGIKYSLVSTITRNVNENEIPQIVDFFFNSKALSLMFQPATFTGEASKLPANEDRVTIPDVIKEIEKNSHVKKGDFNPLPCSHFTCFALSYYLKIQEGKYLSLKEFLGKDKYLDVIANRTLPGLDKEGYSIIKEKIYDMWSAADSSSSDELILKRIREIFKELNNRDFSSKKAFSLGANTMKAIFIHHFMDVDTLDFARLIKCCNHYPQTNGRLMPICAQNVFFQ